jgi:branched-subunit amino acid transport protein
VNVEPLSGPAAVLAVVGLAVLTLVTRGFFLFSRREVPLPAWLLRGLRFAPLAAMAAVVVPAVVLDPAGGLAAWHDARLWAAAAGAATYYWRRSILATIVAGMVVFIALRMLAVG